MDDSDRGERAADPQDGQQETGAPTPRAPRDSLFLHAVIRHAGSEESFPLRVRNISSGGLMADCAEPFAKGEQVELEVRGIGTQAAHIAWLAEGRIGVSFDRPINPMLVRRPVNIADKPAPAANPFVSHKRPGFRTR